MDVKNFVGLLVFGVIGIIVLAAFVPIISETTSATKTFENDGYFRLTKITDEEEHVITWDYTKPYDFVVDGTDTVSLPFGSTNTPIFPYSVISAENWALRFISTTNGVRIDLAVFGGQNSLIWGTSTIDEKNATFTFSNGSATITRSDEATTTQTYDYAFIPASNGEYIMKKSNESAYLNGDSEIFATGRTGLTLNGGTTNANINVQATITDGADVTLIYPTTLTADNIVVNDNAVNGYIDLYTFDNITFEVTDGEYSDTAVYGQVIVPHEVTAEKSVHPDDALSAVIDLLPLIAGIGLFIILVAEFLYSRYL